MIKKETQGELELIVSEQKQRIFELRDENERLMVRLGELEHDKSAIAASLIGAQKLSEKLVSGARHRSQILVEEALGECRRLEEQKRHYLAQITELREKCERILEVIDFELEGRNTSLFCEKFDTLPQSMPENEPIPNIPPDQPDFTPSYDPTMPPAQMSDISALQNIVCAAKHAVI